MKTSLLLVVLLVSGQSVSLAQVRSGITSENAVNHPPTLSPEEQMQIDQYNYLYQQQQAAIAAQTAAVKKAKQDADAQAEYDAAVAKLTKVKDDAIAILDAKYNPTILELESQDSTFKQRAAQLETQKYSSAVENARLRAKQLFRPKDPWRLLNGKIYNAKDADWLQFTGTILEIRANGILVRGDFGPPLENGYGERDYFILNYPVQLYPMADGESFTTNMNLVAHFDVKSSTYQYTNTTIDLRINTVRKLDYGTIIDNPPPDLAEKWNNIAMVSDDNPQLTKELDDVHKEQSGIELKLSQIKSDFDKERDPIIADYEAKIKDLPNVLAQRAKEASDAKKQAVADKALKYNQEQADKGDPIGLEDMGERYRDGNDVPKDLNKAREYFEKAKIAGNPLVDDELKKMDQSPTDSTMK
jgi:hypothetical protein